MYSKILFLDSITVHVDNEVYGRITPPVGGFAAEKDKLQLTAAERWKMGTKLAPFDQEVNKIFYLFLLQNIVFDSSI